MTNQRRRLVSNCAPRPMATRFSWRGTCRYTWQGQPGSGSGSRARIRVRARAWDGIAWCGGGDLHLAAGALHQRSVLSPRGLHFRRRGRPPLGRHGHGDLFVVVCDSPREEGAWWCGEGEDEGWAFIGHKSGIVWVVSAGGRAAAGIEATAEEG